MFVYSPAELHRLNRTDITVPRSVRRTIFGLRLWQPTRQRLYSQRSLRAVPGRPARTESAAGPKPRRSGVASAFGGWARGWVRSLPSRRGSSGSRPPEFFYIYRKSSSIDQHVTNVVRACNFHLRSLRHLRPSLTFESAKSMATAIIGARMVGSRSRAKRFRASRFAQIDTEHLVSAQIPAGMTRSCAPARL